MPEEGRYTPDVEKLIPHYGSVNQDTPEDYFGQMVGQTTVDSDGTKWVSKPPAASEAFSSQIYMIAHRWVADLLDSPIRDRVVDGVYQVRHEDIFGWTKRLREMSLDELEQIHNARVANIHLFLQKCANLTLARASLESWMKTYIELGGYMGVSFNLYKVTEGIYDDAIRRKATKEPYFSQIRLGTAAFVGETEANKRLKEYKGLLETLRQQSQIFDDLQSIERLDQFDALREKYPTRLS